MHGAAPAVRGAPDRARAPRGRRRARADPPDVVVNVDADVSFEPDYFERLLDAFAADPALGIASGSVLRARATATGASGT